MNLKQIEYQGEIYESISELASAYNVKVSTLHSRLNRGWSLEKALESSSVDVNARCKGVSYKGVTYSSFVDLAMTLKVEYSMFMNIYRGRGCKDIDKTLNFYKNKTKKYILHGNVFNSLSDVATYYGLDDAIFYKAHSKNKGALSLQDCVKQCLLDSEVTFKGKKYKNLDSLLSCYNLTHSLFHTRLGIGWDLARAIETPKGL